MNELKKHPHTKSDETKEKKRADGNAGQREKENDRTAAQHPANKKPAFRERNVHGRYGLDFLL